MGALLAAGTNLRYGDPVRARLTSAPSSTRARPSALAIRAGRVGGPSRWPSCIHVLTLGGQLARRCGRPRPPGLVAQPAPCRRYRSLTPARSSSSSARPGCRCARGARRQRSGGLWWRRNDDGSTLQPRRRQPLARAGRPAASPTSASSSSSRIEPPATTPAIAGGHPTRQRRCGHFDPETIELLDLRRRGAGRRPGSSARRGTTRSRRTTRGRLYLTHDRLGVTKPVLSFGGALRAPDDATDADGSGGLSARTRRSCAGAATARAWIRWRPRSALSSPGSRCQSISCPVPEALVAKASPLTLYCAFIQHVREKLGAGPRSARKPTAGWPTGARARQGAMEASATEHWQAAAELRRQRSARSRPSPGDSRPATARQCDGAPSRAPSMRFCE